jgi:hypothetical protein
MMEGIYSQPGCLLDERAVGRCVAKPGTTPCFKKSKLIETCQPTTHKIKPVQLLPPQLHAALPANPARADLVFATIAPILSTSLPLAPSTLEAD